MVVGKLEGSRGEQMELTSIAELSGRIDSWLVRRFWDMAELGTRGRGPLHDNCGQWGAWGWGAVRAWQAVSRQ